MRSHEVAFDLTQELFVSFWRRRAKLEFEVSVSAYLYGSMRKLLLMHMRTNIQKQKCLDEALAFAVTRLDNSTEEQVALHDLEEAVEKSLAALPKRCREIFRLSRKEHKSIQEISRQLNISSKTVENQLTTAIKHLRVSLGDFMVLVVLAAGIS